MNRLFNHCAYVLLALASLCCAASQIRHWPVRAIAASLRPADETTRARVQAAYGQLPLSFEINRGQADPSVKFLARGGNYQLALTATGAARLALRKDSQPPATLHMQLSGAHSSPPVEGLDALPGQSHYLLGNDPQQWRTNVATCARVRYAGVYPGVDLIYYGNGRQLEYDFIIAPGAKPEIIKLAFDGAKRVAIDATGELLLQTRSGELRQRPPVIYQNVNGARRVIAGRYVKLGARQVGFRIAAYDRRLPLVIDPVLSYTTQFGGSGNEAAFGIALDPSGNVYVTGATTSIDFAVTSGGARTTFAGGSCNNGSTPALCTDVFVTKLNATGTELIYSTYFGGSSFDEARDIAVDAAGNAYITGQTASRDLPTANPLQRENGATAFSNGTTDPLSSSTLHPDAQAVAEDAFVAKLNATGSALIYATYLGGSARDAANSIAVDAAGNAYVGGGSASPDFPTVQAWQPSLKGSGDGFIAKLNPAGTALVYATYLGGSGGDTVAAIALDGAANVYATGTAGSTDFPTTPGALQPEGKDDPFVTKLNAAGTELVYSTYLGGTNFNYSDGGRGIAVDAGGHAYVAGFTHAFDFPTTPGAMQTNRLPGACLSDLMPVACPDGFVSKLNATGSTLIYSTLISTAGGDEVNAISVDAAGNAHVAGRNGRGYSGGPRGLLTLFAAKLNAAGSAFSYFVPTNSLGLFYDVAIDGAGNLYGAGTSTEVDRFFLFSSPSNNFDVAVARIGPGGNLVNANVSSASYARPPLARASLATIFGVKLAATLLAASSVPLPTTLGGTTVRIKDSAGVERLAPLLYVSPEQINYQVPPETAPGTATVTVTNSDGDAASAMLPITDVAPGLFFVGAINLRSVPAALVLRVKADGTQSYEPVARFDAATGLYSYVPIDLGEASDQVYLILFGTGWRGRSAEAAVEVDIGGVKPPVLYAGAQGDLVGLDQINVRLPRSLLGRERVDIMVVVDGKPANTVRVSIK